MQLREADLDAGRKLGEAIVEFLASIACVGRNVQPLANERPTTTQLPPGTPSTTTKQSLIPLLVSPREAAKLLSISPRTLWGLTSPRGPIAVVHLGRLVRYSVDDLKSAISTLKNNG